MVLKLKIFYCIFTGLSSSDTFRTPSDQGIPEIHEPPPILRKLNLRHSPEYQRYSVSDRYSRHSGSGNSPNHSNTLRRQLTYGIPFGISHFHPDSPGSSVASNSPNANSPKDVNHSPWKTCTNVILF